MPYGRFNRGSRKGSRRGRYGVARRPVWVRTSTISGANPVAGNDQNVDLIPDGNLDPGAKIGSTVTRVRGRLSIQMNTGAGFPDQRFYWGIVIGPRQGELISAYADRNQFQWLHWEEVSVGGETQYLVQGSNVAWGRNYDVKAQRIITQPSESLYGCISYNPSTVITPSPWQDYRLTASVLLKLA